MNKHNRCTNNDYRLHTSPLQLHTTHTLQNLFSSTTSKTTNMKHRLLHLLQPEFCFVAHCQLSQLDSTFQHECGFLHRHQPVNQTGSASRLVKLRKKTYQSSIECIYGSVKKSCENYAHVLHKQLYSTTLIKKYYSNQTTQTC